MKPSNRKEANAKIFNAGYSLGLFLDFELAPIVQKKMSELSFGDNGEKWKLMTKAYEMAMKERRLKQLGKIKKGKDKEPKERTR